MTKPPNEWSAEHEGRLIAMMEIATAAGDHTLKYFQSDALTIDAKVDDSPVTIADREAEQLARKLIAERFVDDTVQGEEFDDQTGTSRYRWIIDPNMERCCSSREQRVEELKDTSIHPLSHFSAA